MTVLFLNGCTSAGKTSVARQLQALLDPPHLYLGIDDAFAMLPARLHSNREGFFFDADERGEVRLNFGPFGLATLRAHSLSAASIAKAGMDLILDEVVLEKRLRQDWDATLAGLDVFAVGLHCALPELDRRELARRDRIIGQARGQYDLVHRGMTYDYQLDVTALSTAEAAEQICSAYQLWRAALASRADD